LPEPHLIEFSISDAEEEAHRRRRELPAFHPWEIVPLRLVSVGKLRRLLTEGAPETLGATPEGQPRREALAIQDTATVSIDSTFSKLRRARRANIARSVGPFAVNDWQTAHATFQNRIPSALGQTKRV
jgi:hypothetical protein